MEDKQKIVEGAVPVVPLPSMGGQPPSYPQSVKYADYYGQQYGQQRTYPPQERYIIEREPGFFDNFWPACGFSSLIGACCGCPFPFLCICCLPTKPGRLGWTLGAFACMAIWGLCSLIVYGAVFMGLSTDSCIGMMKGMEDAPDNPEATCRALQGVLVIWGGIAFFLGGLGVAMTMRSYNRYA